MWCLISTNGECSSDTRNLNKNKLPKNYRFLKNFVLNPQTAHQLSLRLVTGLSVTNSLVYGAIARQSAHELCQDSVVDECCIALPHVQCGHLSTHWAIQKNISGIMKKIKTGKNKHIKSAKTPKQTAFGLSWHGGGRWRLVRVGSWSGRRRPFYLCAKGWAWQTQPWPFAHKIVTDVRR